MPKKFIKINGHVALYNGGGISAPNDYNNEVVKLSSGEVLRISDGLLGSGWKAAGGSSTPEETTPNYLCFTAVDDSVDISMTADYEDASEIELYYKLSTESEWNEFVIDDTIISLSRGESVYFKGNNNTFYLEDSGMNCYFQISLGKVKASGSIMSLLDGDGTTTELTEDNKGCFNYLFYNCTSLITAPELPATTLASRCYGGMFSYCTSLTTAPELPATTLAEECYSSMFEGCASLTSAPELPATTLEFYCYGMMFYDCPSLNYIKLLYPDELDPEYFEDWVDGVSSSGLIYYTGSTTETGTSAIPEGWVITADGSLPIPITTTFTYTGSEIVPKLTNYISSLMTISGDTSGTDIGTYTAIISLKDPTNYKWSDETITNKTVNWSIYMPDYLCFTAEETNSTITLSVRGAPTKRQAFEYSTDRINWNPVTIGTAITLANVGDKIYYRGNNTAVSESTSKYYYFVMTEKIAASGNVMSLLDKTCKGTKISNTCCFFNLFNGCTSLTTAPELPATTLATYCYYNMFSGCTSLISAPNLPATTLAAYCYTAMFSGCTSLTSAPALPATTLANYCYRSMFSYCTSLTTAPELPATTLAEECYSQMFMYCTSLTAAPALPATTLADSCYYYMFYGCTSLTSASALPATTLADICYESMFEGCISLTTAPALPATILTTRCYDRMFVGCTSLQVYSSSGEGHTQAWSIPTSGTASSYTSQSGMFYGTSGDYTSASTVTLNTTFYTQNAPV